MIEASARRGAWLGACAVLLGSAGALLADVPRAATLGSTPVLFKTVVARTLSGTVSVREPDGSTRILSDAPTRIPVRSAIDANAGTVELTSATNAHGGTQTARFAGGTFRLTQNRGVSPMHPNGPKVVFTRLQLTGPVCTATTARKRPRKRKRHVWGTDRGGNWQTSGYNAVATTVHTKWLVEDECDGTTKVKVVRGQVAVSCYAAATIRGAGDPVSAEAASAKTLARLHRNVLVGHGFYRTCGQFAAATVRG